MRAVVHGFPVLTACHQEILVIMMSASCVGRRVPSLALLAAGRATSVGSSVPLAAAANCRLVPLFQRLYSHTTKPTFAHVSVGAMGAEGGADNGEDGSDSDFGEQDEELFGVTPAEREIADTVHQHIDWADVRRIERRLMSPRRRPESGLGRTNVRKSEEDVWLDAGAPGYDAGDKQGE